MPSRSYRHLFFILLTTVCINVHNNANLTDPQKMKHFSNWRNTNVTWNMDDASYTSMILQTCLSVFSQCKIFVSQKRNHQNLLWVIIGLCFSRNYSLCPNATFIHIRLAMLVSFGCFFPIWFSVLSWLMFTKGRMDSAINWHWVTCEPLDMIYTHNTFFFEH